MLEKCPDDLPLYLIEYVRQIVNFNRPILSIRRSRVAPYNNPLPFAKLQSVRQSTHECMNRAAHDDDLIETTRCHYNPYGRHTTCHVAYTAALDTITYTRDHFVRKDRCRTRMIRDMTNRRSLMNGRLCHLGATILAIVTTYC